MEILNLREYSLSFYQSLKEIHSYTKGESAIVVIIDTPIDKDVPFSQKIIYERGIFTPNPSGDIVHGTLVAAMVNFISPEAKIYSLPVYNNSTESTEALLILALDKCLSLYQKKKKPIVVNISLEIPVFPHNDQICDVCDAINSLVMNGIYVIVTAGNCGEKSSDETHSISCPGSSKYGFTIGAICENGRICPFSGKGPTANGTVKPDFVAPGIVEATYQHIFNLFGEKIEINSKGVRYIGTSFAAPIISGIVTLLCSFNDKLNPEKVYELLMDNSIKLNYFPPESKLSQYHQGHGVIDLEQLFKNFFQGD